MLDLFPDSARIREGELEIGGVAASALAERFGTPLVAYCEQTLRARARELRAAVPGALVLYGSKAFPNVAVMQLLAEEGIGADVASLGELAFARRAGIPGERIVVHGNAKSDEELRATAEAGATVALDAEGEMSKNSSIGSAPKRAPARKPPRTAPTTPMIVVMIQPPGSSPGISAFAIPPASNPRMMNAMIPMSFLSLN